MRVGRLGGRTDADSGRNMDVFVVHRDFRNDPQTWSRVKHGAFPPTGNGFFEPWCQ